MRRARDSFPALDERAFRFRNDNVNDEIFGSHHVRWDSLTPEVNTFTAKYRILGGTGSFRYRRMAVTPF